MCETLEYTVEPLYNEVLGTMKITLLYQVSHYIRVKTQRNIKSWDQQNDLVIRGFCYIRPLYNEVPLYLHILLIKIKTQYNVECDQLKENLACNCLSVTLKKRSYDRISTTMNTIII